jgi:cell division protein ZapA (FtsZ GTPase activity inhibitor)
MNVTTKRYKVTLLGERYSLISDEAEELVLKAARFVDERIAMLTNTTPAVDEKKAAVLVALQYASEVLRLEVEREQQLVRHKVLADLIDKAVT